MSIPGQIKHGRNGPMMRDRVGGSIKGTYPGFFDLYSDRVKGIGYGYRAAFLSPTMHGVVWKLSGVTKNSTGTILGSCVVELFYTTTDLPISKTVSDPTTGAFAFDIGPNAGAFYIVAYKAGSPDVAGTTVNTLVPVTT